LGFWTDTIAESWDKKLELLRATAARTDRAVTAARASAQRSNADGRTSHDDF